MTSKARNYCTVSQQRPEFNTIRDGSIIFGSTPQRESNLDASILRHRAKTCARNQQHRRTETGTALSRELL
jgi:hypothetical protein